MSLFASSGLNQPFGLAFDSVGNLYSSNVGGFSPILRFTPGGAGAVFASEGLSSPIGLAFDSAGNLYVANYGSNTIMKFTSGGVRSVFVASGLFGPYGLAFDRVGNLYVTNFVGASIMKFSPDGVGSVFASGNLLSGAPAGLAFDAAGNLFVTNVTAGSIVKFAPNGVGSVFARGGGLIDPRGLAFDSAGNLYVANRNGHTVLKYSPTGTDLGVFGSSSQQRTPESVAFTDDAGVPLPLPPRAPVTPPPPPPLPQPGRITKMSIRSNAGTGAQTLIVGAVIGGAGTIGTTPLLIRGIGPALTAFGVPGALADPTLSVFAGANVVASNDNWNGDAQVISVGNAVGAFQLAPVTSRDAALHAPALAARDYTIQITGVGGTTGIALAELYDASTGAFSATTPQLVNVSARTQVGTGADILIAGFSLAGTTSRTVLIRAVGPTLSGFGVPGVLADPQLALYSGPTQLQQNNDWGAAANAAQITATTNQLGTFALTAGSRDSVILTTLAPGSYTAQVSGVGTTTGVALVEIYLVP